MRDGDDVREGTEEPCAALRFDFLRIICGYEHFVALNMPSADVMERPFEKLIRFPKDLL